MQEVFHQDPKDTLLDKLTKKVAWFMGSWWGVSAHTLWFVGWFVTGAEVNSLTLWVSLEAIFIGIFLLMAGNKAEEERDRKEQLASAEHLAHLQSDVDLDRKQLEELNTIKADLARIKADLKTIKPKPKKS